jgi:hypothetical protein
VTAPPLPVIVLSACHDAVMFLPPVELLEPRSDSSHRWVAPRAPSPALGYTHQYRP